MRRWRSLAVAIGFLMVAMMHGCDVGWDFLQERRDGAGGPTNGVVGAQMACQNSRVVVGQFPRIGGFLSGSGFDARYSSPQFDGSISPQALGLRVSRHRLWLNDLSIEVSFFPFDDTARGVRNGCLGRAILEINIPDEDLIAGRITIRSTRFSLTEPSAFYAEGGDPGFSATAVEGFISLSFMGDNRVVADFEFTFNPGADQRRLTAGKIDADIDHNPVVDGLQ